MPCRSSTGQPGSPASAAAPETRTRPANEPRIFGASRAAPYPPFDSPASTIFVTARSWSTFTASRSVFSPFADAQSPTQRVDGHATTTFSPFTASATCQHGSAKLPA